MRSGIRNMPGTKKKWHPQSLYTEGPDKSPRNLGLPVASKVQMETRMTEYDKHFFSLHFSSLDTNRRAIASDGESRWSSALVALAINDNGLRPVLPVAWVRTWPDRESRDLETCVPFVVPMSLILSVPTAESQPNQTAEVHNSRNYKPVAAQCVDAGVQLYVPARLTWYSHSDGSRAKLGRFQYVPINHGNRRESKSKKA